ncbi:MAG: hypothetical protein QM831_20910 [Kofleriaceae bacterium]
MRAWLVFAAVGCQAPTAPVVANEPPAPAPHPQIYAIKDPKVVDLIHHDPDAFNEYTIDEYQPEDGINEAAAAKLETCAYLLTTEHDRKVRSLALDCVGRERTGLPAKPSPMTAHIVATIDDLIDHETDAELRRNAVFDMEMITSEITHDPKMIAKLNNLAFGSLKTDPEFSALAWIPSSDDRDKLTPDENAFALQLLAADLGPGVNDVPFSIAPAIGDAKACPIVKTLLRTDAKALEKATSYVLQDKHCPDLRDLAVDMFVAKTDVLFRLASFDLKQFTPAQLKRLREAAKAFRARTKDPQDADMYIHWLTQ